MFVTSPNTPCLGTVICACSRLSQPRTPYGFPQVLVHGRNTCSRSGLTESSKYSFSNETWNIGCTLISGGNANLEASSNTYLTIENGPANLAMNLGVRPCGNVKFFTFNHTFCPTLKLTCLWFLLTYFSCKTKFTCSICPSV